MTFDVHIQNTGKLDSAKVEFGQFTVLAGPNNTGKSFVSKIMYSLFNAMNANHAEESINDLMRPINQNRLVDLIKKLLSRTESNNSEINSIFKSLLEIGGKFENFTLNDIDGLDVTLADIVEAVKNIRDAVTNTRDLPRLISDELRIPSGLLERHWEEFVTQVVELHECLESMEAGSFFTRGITFKVRHNLLQNFQISSLADLRGKKDIDSKVKIQNFGEFSFGNDDFDFRINHTGLLELQAFSKVLYIESPIYWRLKNALGEVRIDGLRSRLGRERITGVPGYFYDLADALRYEYTGEVDFQDICDKLTKEIGGEIKVSEDGNLLFHEDNRNFTLPITALGVANLGVLALLIERKVLDKNTFLFIDEPEAHLHPAWQVIMADALFALAEKGVHVVIATHSPDILKWLEVHAKKNPEAKELIALNKFPINSEESDSQDFDDKMAAIKRELTKPFADLYTAGL